MDLIASSRKIMLKFEPPAPHNVISFGNKVIADIIGEIKMRSYVTRMGL